MSGKRKKSSLSQSSLSGSDLSDAGRHQHQHHSNHHHNHHHQQQQLQIITVINYLCRRNNLSINCSDCLNPGRQLEILATKKQKQSNNSGDNPQQIWVQLRWKKIETLLTFLYSRESSGDSDGSRRSRSRWLATCYCYSAGQMDSRSTYCKPKIA